MNTSRPSSRNQQYSSTSHLNGSSYQPHPPPVRRAKVASTAQMDIGSLGASNYSTIKTHKSPGSTVSTSSGVSSSRHLYANSHSGYPSPGKGPGSTVSSVSSSPYTHHHTTSSNSTVNGGGAPRTVRLRSTNSVVSTASYSSRTGTGAETRDSVVTPSVVGTGATVYHPAGAGGSKSTGSGSVTSDDGTVSEDSDLTRGIDDSSSPLNQNHNSNHSSVATTNPRALYAANGRQNSYASSTSASGPKVTTQARTRTLTASSVKPVRMAAGAAIRVDTTQASSSHAGSSSLTSPTAVGDSTNGGHAPSSLSTGSVSGHSATWSTNSTVGVGSRSHSNPGYLSVPRSLVNGADDTGSVVSMSSAVSSVAHSQLHPPTGNQPTTIRVSKSANATLAANKLAEENRLAEEAARTRRKIDDLKISNDSLLQINASLEATVRRQANEVQELKNRVAQLTGDNAYSPADLALMRSVDAIELSEAERKGDVIFKRLCYTIENMLNEARQALDSTKPAGVKVLSSYDMYIKEMENDLSEDDDGDDARSNPSDSEDDDGEGGNKRNMSDHSGSSSTRLDSSYSSSSSKRNSSSSLSNASSVGKPNSKDDDHEARNSLDGPQLKHALSVSSPSNATLSDDRSSFMEEPIAA